MLISCVLYKINNYKYVAKFFHPYNSWNNEGVCKNGARFMESPVQVQEGKGEK